MKKKLTIKEEKFCQLVVEYGDQTKAYREAFDVKKDALDKTHHEAASKYASKNSTRIEEIKQELREKNIMSKEEIMEHLKDILTMTKHSEKEKAIALKAIDQYTKMVGGYEPVKVDIKQEWDISFGGEEEDDQEDEA